MKHCLKLAAIICATLIVSVTAEVKAEQMTKLSQYGITWTFDKPVEAGQFITGDWWVIGPVTVVEISPAPGAAKTDEKIDTPDNHWGDTSLQNNNQMRNGSMIVLKASGQQGYDSRNQSYKAELSVKLPVTIEPNRSLISTISNESLPVDNFAAKIMWPREKRSECVLKTAAVLTVLDSAPPADAFRPPYAGTKKPIYRKGNLQWQLLKNLPAPKVAASAYPYGYKLKLPNDWDQMERYFQRPWLEHQNSWVQQQVNPNENQTNYGRENSRLISLASLMLHIDAPRQRKEKLLIGLVQYGIDIWGVAHAGGDWNCGGGHSSGRKWPPIFASLMLDAPELRQFPDTTVFHEDAQTYYGTGWFGQSALYWMIQHHGRRDRYEHRPPETWGKWDKSTESYRICCNAVAWIGTCLSARLMGAIEQWDHDAYFDYCDRWMAQEDEYAANRGKHKRPKQEGKTQDPFVDAMWHAYRDKCPDQPMAGNPRMFVWNKGPGFKWVPNPKPTAEEIARHLAELKEKAASEEDK